MRQRRMMRSLVAWAVMATGVVDRGYRSFDRLRSKMVVACGSDEFFDIYNDLLYARRIRASALPPVLTPFEERAISQHFPAPPAAVLVGAAGIGREAVALARQGYRVVAFEPARPLAVALSKLSGESVESLVGRYEHLPMVSSVSDPPERIDLRSRAPFSAAILGYGSISHLRSDEHCIATLRQFRQLTRGPILLSYTPSFGGPKRRFHVGTGFVRPFTGSEIRELAEHAELEVLHLDDGHPWYAVLRRSDHENAC